MREQELADRRIECEAMYALPGRVHHHGAGSIDDVTRCNLPAAGLEKVLERTLPAVGDLAHNGEDCTDGHIDIDIR